VRAHSWLAEGARTGGGGGGGDGVVKALGPTPVSCATRWCSCTLLLGRRRVATSIATPAPRARCSTAAHHTNTATTQAPCCHSPHSLSKKARTSALSTFLSMLAAYTVLLQRSRSSLVRGISSLSTGTIAVLEGSTRSGEPLSMEPAFCSACCTASSSVNSMKAKRLALLGSPHTRQSTILPQSEKKWASCSSVTCGVGSGV
jgi:hypothetical protein